MKRTGIVFTILLIAFTACKQKQQEVKPVIKQLTEAIYASGTLVPEHEYKVVPATEGFVANALVKEGDTIAKGQLLFVLSNDVQQAQVQAAGSTVQKTLPVASSNSPAIKEIENRIATAKTRVRNDSLQYERYKNLYNQQAISLSQFERYQLQFEASTRELQGLQQQLQQQRLSSSLQLQQASNQLQLAKAQQGNGNIKSYVSGVVYDVYKQPGDMVYPNQPLALIGAGRMIARLLADEDDLAKISVGQKVLITMDAYPGKIFNATIKKIYPILNKVEQSFRVDAEFDDALPPGMYGLNIEANIVINEKVQALVIPKKAVMKGDSIMIKEGDKITKLKITKGTEDKDWVQVTGGIHSTSQSIILQ